MTTPLNLTVSSLASLPESVVKEWLGSLTPAEKQAFYYDWSRWARPSQLPPPGDWRYWLVKAGRGFGKTRVGAEWVRAQVKTSQYVNLVGATADDAKQIMVEGESGILAICPPDERPAYKRQDRLLEWPNGAKSLIFTADEPERLRGKQSQKLWADEVGAWRYADEAFTQVEMGLRLPPCPQAVITTTPRPTRLLKRLMADPGTVVTNGTSYENRANLDEAWYGSIINRYEGTRMGRQELLAEMLLQNPDALWQLSVIDATRVAQHPDLECVVVAVDPAVTSGDESAETGIVVAGRGKDKQYYVLADVTLRGTPREWASQAILAYHTHKADRLIGEVNNGGQMIEETIRNIDRQISYKEVRATRGKLIRAEPIAALYEQAKVHHVGTFPQLEDQLCEWSPGMDSPDRMDALVWAMTELSAQSNYVPWVGATMGRPIP